MLHDEKANHELLGECLSVPSFETLCQSRSQINVKALCAAREAFCQQFADALHDGLIAVWQAIETTDYIYDQRNVNARRCKNVVLGHLARTSHSASLIRAQYDSADNMTDALASLKAAQICDGELFSDLMTRFGERWEKEPLVLDKWFALHATTEREDILAHITMLKSHPQFSIGNPNRVRALIGSFAFYNSTGFHAEDGSGYEYVTSYLIELDKQNPQVASRIVTPLTQWQNYAPVHQQLMKAQLQRLLNHEGLSKDVFEKVSKSLAYEKRD